MIDWRSIPIAIAWRNHGARRSLFDAPALTPSAGLRVALAELEVLEVVAGDLVERDPGRALERLQVEPNVGEIASTSPPRMACSSEFVSVMSLKSISLIFGFVPAQYGFAFRTEP